MGDNETNNDQLRNPGSMAFKSPRDPEPLERPLQRNKSITEGEVYELKRKKSSVVEKIVYITAVGERRALGHPLYWMQTIKNGTEERGWVKCLPLGESIITIDDFIFRKLDPSKLPTNDSFCSSSVFDRLERQRKRVSKEKEI